jgi:hypothetical protein
MSNVERPVPFGGRAVCRLVRVVPAVPVVPVVLALAVLASSCSYEPAVRVVSTGEETVVGFDDLPVGVAGWVGWQVVLRSGEAELVEARFINVEPGMQIPEVRAVRASEVGRIVTARADRDELPPLPEGGPAGMPVTADPAQDWYLLIQVVAREPGPHAVRNLELTFDVDGRPARHVEPLTIEVR